MAEETELTRVIKKEQMGQLALTIKISKDKLSLFLDSAIVQSKEKIIVDRDTLIMILKEHVKKNLLNEAILDIIAKAANSGKGMQDRKVAQGTPPVNGEDGKLDLVVKAVEIPTNSDDTRFVRDIQRVVPGMFLGIVQPPSKGKAGIDILGEEIKAKPGKPLKVPTDRTITQKPSTKEGNVEYLISTSHGFLVREKEKLRVQPVLQIKKDVAITSGDVNCNGKVEIGGDVPKGSKVISRDDMYIKGRTHGSGLTSQGGTIKVDGLVLGGPGIVANAGGGIIFYMTQNLKASTDGNITISKEARDSSLEALGSIILKQGHLFGGQAFALGGIEAGIVGSDGGSSTVVGSRSKQDVQAEVAKLKDSLTEHEKLQEAISSKLGLFGTPETEKFPILDLIQCRKINEFILKLDNVCAAKASIERKLHVMNEALAREPWFQLNYMQVIHKGVVIKIGEDQFIVDPYLTGPGTITYSAETRKFTDGKYKELEALKPKRKEQTP